jgi:peroxiredoxin family protein
VQHLQERRRVGTGDPVEGRLAVAPSIDDTVLHPTVIFRVGQLRGAQAATLNALTGAWIDASPAARDCYIVTRGGLQPGGTMPADGAKSMSIIVTRGTLDWAYPPFILATTAAAMGLNVAMFFTFYGLPLLLKKLDLQVSPLGNPAMKLPLGGMHMGMPNIASMIPFMDAAATAMMKDLMKRKGVASIEELRSLAVESEVRLIGCQMTMDLFEYSVEDMIDGVEIGGAATYIEVAAQSGINLFI